MRTSGGGEKKLRALTLVMPYMVVGSMTVVLGVISRGVDGPNTAIVLGANTLSECNRASSNTFCKAKNGIPLFLQKGHQIRERNAK